MFIMFIASHNVPNILDCVYVIWIWVLFLVAICGIHVYVILINAFAYITQIYVVKKLETSALLMGKESFFELNTKTLSLAAARTVA